MLKIISSNCLQRYIFFIVDATSYCFFYLLCKKKIHSVFINTTIMKSTVKFILALFILLTFSNVSQAQTSIPLPNSSFENWSNGNGYSVTVIFIQLPVYESYTYPSDWNYPSYPVNQTVTYSGMNVNINTILPLIKVSHETSSVADGSSALKMQTFMLSDIINSTVYNLAQSSIDPELTSMVFPSILSTGEMDLDQMMPFMYTITSNMNSLAQLMATFVNEDINDYIDGGVALNGLVPGQLTGQYKYTSATGSGDNGGILMLGTKYNTNTHRREVVGAGYTTSLTDTSTYTAFNIEYRPMSEIIPTQPMIDPDSLVIILFSSANNQRQQGSILYLDNLQLWAYEPDIHEDTCADVTGLTVDYVDTTLASLSWAIDENPDYWEAEYGIQGFSQGNGNVMTTVNNSLILSELQPDTYYDVYVRSICNDSIAGDWSFISFKTDEIVPPDPDTTSVQTFAADHLICYPNPANGQCQLQFQQEKPLFIQLFSIDGKLLQQITPQTETITVSLPYSGVFILRCEMAQGIIVRKIINH